MSDHELPSLKYLKNLEAVGKLGRDAARRLGDGERDPFVRRKILSKVAAEVEALGIPKSTAMQALELAEQECLRCRAGFWDDFAIECANRGWRLVGSTGRRMIQEGVFIEVDGDEVKVSETGASLATYAPSVARALATEVQEVERFCKESKRFVDQLAVAHDAVPGDQEKPLEAVYRQYVMVVQKPGFWRTLLPAQFTRISRPMFRAALTAVMEQGLRARDGRVPRFGTALAGEYWEVYSPGEGRIVQVGRLSFA